MALLKLAVLCVCSILGVSSISDEGYNQTSSELGDPWWGPGNEQAVDDTVKSFQVNFTTTDVDDLKQRLRSTRLSKPALEGTGWTYGMDSNFIPEIVDHWLNKYDFEAREAHLNQYPQFTTNIQGLDIHFLHVQPNQTDGKRVLPLLMEHGWPGSVVEFYKIIPLLTTPRDGYDFVFEVIVPSIPGFGFSSGTTKPGLGTTQIAVVLKNLMLRLGFDKFYTQAGDMGAIITANMAAMFPQHILGYHSNVCMVTQAQTNVTTDVYSFWPTMLIPATDYNSTDSIDMTPKWSNLSQQLEMTGYAHIQTTKPDTLGIALSDSPAGLAAWILEKFSMGTNAEWRFRADGGLFGNFSATELLDNVMLYWIPNSMTTAMRLYAEHWNFVHTELGMESVPIEVPSACAQFPKDLWSYSESVLRTRFKNLVRVAKMPRGGHFAAFEEPELLADEVWTSIGIMESDN